MSRLKNLLEQDLVGFQSRAAVAIDNFLSIISGYWKSTVTEVDSLLSKRQEFVLVLLWPSFWQKFIYTVQFSRT